MLSKVAGHYQGAYPILELLKLKYRGMKFWYDIMIREIIEKNIISDLVSKKKEIPSPQSIKRMVDKKIRGLSE